MPVFTLPAEVLDSAHPRPLDPNVNGRDSNDLAVRELMKELQGNILKGHGRDFVCLALLHFDAARQAEIRVFLKALAADVTWASGQMKQRTGYVDLVRRLRSDRMERAAAVSDKHLVRSARAEQKSKWSLTEQLLQPGETPFVSVMLAREGYGAVGITAVPADEVFQAGMAGAAKRVNDVPADWQAEYQVAGKWHALVMVAADEAAVADAMLQTLLARAPNGLIAEKHEERGGQLYRGGLRVEPFGFADGLSGPIFLQEDLDRARGGRGALPWNPCYPLGRVIAETVPGSQWCGSYFVLRKLEQNVAAFAGAMNALGPGAGGVEALGAAVVGRFADGTPLASASVPARPDPQDPVAMAQTNHFTYPARPEMGKCPFGAHVRRTNPRGVMESKPELLTERKVVLARRGLPYDDRSPARTDFQWKPTDLPEKKVGLLFMAYAGDLTEQFVKMQKDWMNQGGVAASPASIDPIAGQPVRSRAPGDTIKYYCPANRTVDLPSFVTMRGGEYFFAPPRTLFESL